MNLRQALLKNISWNLIGVVLTFINNILIVRALGVENSGVFFYNIVFLTFFITIMRFGIENGFLFLSAKYKNFTSTLFIFLFPIIFFQSIITFLVLKYVISSGQTFPVFWATIFVAINILSIYMTAFFQAKKMFSSVNFLSATGTGLQTIFLIFLFFSHQYNYDGIFHLTGSSYSEQIFIALILATVIQIISLLGYFYFKQVKHFKVIKPTATIFSILFRYSGASFINSILLFLITRTDIYFIEKYCSNNILSNYIQAAKIGQLLLIVPGLIGGVIFPFSIDSNKQFPQKIAYLCRLMSMLFSVIFIAALCFGYYFFPALLGKDFDLVYPTLLITIFGIFFAGINIILISYFEGKDLQRIIIITNLITFLLILIGDSVFVSLYGYLVAAIIFSVSNLIGMIIFISIFLKLTGVKFTEIFCFSFKDIKAAMLLKR